MTCMWSGLFQASPWEVVLPDGKCPKLTKCPFVSTEIYVPSIALSANRVLCLSARTNHLFVRVTDSAWLTWWDVVLIRVSFIWLALYALYRSISPSKWSALRDQAQTLGTFGTVQAFNCLVGSPYSNLVPSAFPAICFLRWKLRMIVLNQAREIMVSWSQIMTRYSELSLIHFLHILLSLYCKLKINKLFLI